METNRSDCLIPCTLNGCRKELHHFIDCPIWHCFDTVTTTTQTTTLSPSPLSTTTFATSSTTTEHITTTAITERPITLSPLPPLDHPGYLYSSIALNIIFFLILWSLLIQTCKKCITRRIRRFRNRSNSVTENEPIIRTHGHSQNRSQSRPTSHSRFVNDLTSSSEDFDTRESIPLINRHSDFPNVFASSPRVPSFLNSPVLPSEANQERHDTLPAFSSSISIASRQRRSLFDSENLTQDNLPNKNRRERTGTGLFGSEVGSPREGRSIPSAGSTFKPNPRQTRKDTSWRKNLETETTV